MRSDRVVKASPNGPDEAIVVDGGDGPADETVSVVYSGQLEKEVIPPTKLSRNCEERQVKRYSYLYLELEWAE